MALMWDAELAAVFAISTSTTWISNRFVAGHRIRVEVCSGADNSIFPNTNTGLPLCDDVDTVIAHQKVYHGGRYPSCVILPIMPEEA